MIRHLNIQTQYGVETWETIDRADYNSYKEFVKEIRNLKENYALMGYILYTSQRASKN
jgi:hypothetical protein